MSLRDRAGALADRVPGWVLVGLVVASMALFVWGLVGALSREEPPPGGAGPVPEATRTVEPAPTSPPPTDPPTDEPTKPPTEQPTKPPTEQPTESPTEQPSEEPSTPATPKPVPTEGEAYVLVTLPDSITPPSSFVCAPVEDVTHYCLALFDEVKGTSLEPAQAPDPVPAPAAPDSQSAVEEGQPADPSPAAAASSGPRLIDDITTIGGVLIAPMMLATAAIITSLQSRPKASRPARAGAVSRERRRPAR